MARTRRSRSTRSRSTDSTSSNEEFIFTSRRSSNRISALRTKASSAKKMRKLESHSSRDTSLCESDTPQSPRRRLTLETKTNKLDFRGSDTSLASKKKWPPSKKVQRYLRSEETKLRKVFIEDTSDSSDNDDDVTSDICKSSSLVQAEEKESKSVTKKGGNVMDFDNLSDYEFSITPISSNFSSDFTISTDYEDDVPERRQRMTRAASRRRAQNKRQDKPLIIRVSELLHVINFSPTVRITKI